MAVEMLEKRYPSTDGEHQLYTRIFVPEKEPVAIFHVVHGMTEHIRRYEGFMKEMAEAGYLCFGFDNLGHGYSVNDESELGFIAHEKGWLKMSEDVWSVAKAIRAEYSTELPYYLLGHSMGSFIVRETQKLHPQFIDRLIIMGTGGPNPAASAGLALIRNLKIIKGEKGYSSVIENLAIGNYNKRFDSNQRGAWLSKIDAVRDAYYADPLCTFRFTLSAYFDLITLTKITNTTSWFKSYRKDLPTFIISGEDDPVGDFSKGVTTVYQKLKANGADVQMKLYEDCRHEILNETCRDEVIADIKAFLSS